MPNYFVTTLLRVAIFESFGTEILNPLKVNLPRRGQNLYWNAAWMREFSPRCPSLFLRNP